MKLSVVLATKNEESNIAGCLDSVKDIASEIIIFDEASSDKTVEIARKYNAKVTNYVNKTNFHETKQKAIEATTGEWVLQIDADERVTPKLADEILKVIKMSYTELIKRTSDDKNKRELFIRHQNLIAKREGRLGKETGEIAAFFIPRLNFFLGKPLIHAGVYPDGVIRLFKNGKARLPGKSVHELMEVDGEVGWLFNDLEHHESPTFSRYFERAGRYTDLTANDYRSKNISTDLLTLFYYCFIKPISVFIKLFIIHRGFLDGMRGFAWSAFSALHFPLAYFKYYSSVNIDAEVNV